MSDKWVCGKCAREVAQGVDDGQIPEHHRTCPKRAQTEPTVIQFAARRNGKSQALIDSMLAQANEHGIRVEVVYPQPEPEYEYQWGHPDSDFSSNFFGYDPYPTYEEALADMREDGDPVYVVVRRVKAGAWEPVPNQEGERHAGGATGV